MSMTMDDIERERAFEFHDGYHNGDPVDGCKFCDDRLLEEAEAEAEDESV